MDIIFMLIFIIVVSGIFLHFDRKKFINYAYLCTQIGNNPWR